MALIHSPNIVTSGRILHLDAASVRSYPGSGTTWTDVSGNGNTGTLTNGPTFNSANGGGIVFDGVNDLVTVPDSSTLRFSNANFTVESFITISSISGKQRIVSKGSSGWSQGWHIAARPTQWEFECSDGVSSPGNSFLINTTTTVGTYHVVWGVTSTTATLYVNGVQLGSTQTITEGVAFATSTVTMGIGAYELGGEHFNGRIFSVKLYNFTLNATQVLQNFNAIRDRFGV